MDRTETDELLRLAEAIADGRAWDEAGGEVVSSGDPVMEQFRVLARLSDVHRSQELDATYPLPSPPGLPPPSDWGPFRILEEIGRGSFGSVYRARDLRLDRDVALKLFPLRSGDHAQPPPVVSEGRLLAKVQHANVITVFGADVIDGRAGIWMEHLQGRTLQQELDDRGPLGAREAALIGIDVCHALAAVHRAGLVHRDVKAQNVMRAAGGRIVLMDFGAGHEVRDFPRGGVVAGTPLYMAPEVLAGAPATAATDLYSLGILLYHLVTNDFPVTASSVAELEGAHAAGTRRRLRDVRPDLPASFIKTVEDATAPDPAGRIATAAAFESRLESVLVSTDAERAPHGSRKGLVMAAALALMVGMSAAVGFYGENIRTYLSPAPAVSIRSLVVMPFANQTGQQDQDYLSDSISQIINGHLARLKPLSVTSNDAAMTYKGRQVPVGKIASELKVEGVVEGEMQRSGDQLRITVRLRRADESEVWGKTFDLPAGNLLTVTGEIAAMIAGASHLPLTPIELNALRSTPGMDVRAQEAFLRGLHRLTGTFEAAILQQALGDLQRAVQLDPSSARAFAALSQCYRMLGARGALSRKEAYDGALASANRALELTDDLAEAHIEIAELTLTYDWNWEWAGKEYQRALDLSPSNSYAMARYSQYLSALGRHDEAVQWALRARQNDPISHSVRFTPGMAYYYKRQYDEAIEAFLELKTLPDFELTTADRVGLARAYTEKGQYEDAVAEMQAVLSKAPKPHPAWVAELARIYAVAGRRDEARELLRQIEPATGEIPGNIATVLIALGSYDAAFPLLERAVQARLPFLVWFNVDPRFDPIRTDPRFRELAIRLGIPQ